MDEIYQLEAKIEESLQRAKTYLNDIKDITFRGDVLRKLDLVSAEICDIKRYYIEIEEKECEGF